MVIINGEYFNLSNTNDIIRLNKYYEKDLLTILINKGFNFYLSRNEKCCYNLFNFNKKNNIRNFLELKTRLFPITKLNVEYINVENVKKYKLIQSITYSSDICYFFYIYNYLINDMLNEYYYFKINLDIIDNYFITNINNKRVYEIPIKELKPIDILFKITSNNNNFQKIIDKSINKDELILNKDNEIKELVISNIELDMIVKKKNSENIELKELLLYQVNKYEALMKKKDISNQIEPKII